MMFLEFVEAVARVADRVVQFLVAGGDRPHGTAFTGLSGKSGMTLGDRGAPGTAEQLEQIEEEFNVEDRDSDLSSGRLSSDDGKTTIGEKPKDPFVKNEVSSMATQTPRGFMNKSKKKRDIKNNMGAYNNSIGMDMKL
jgi:hypothetical protein